MPFLGDPILSCAEAAEFERRLFGDAEPAAWTAMRAAGRAVAAAVRRDFAEIGGFPPDGKALVLAGKGHNGGDALIAARAILEAFPESRADILFVFGERTLRPLARRAWRELAESARDRATTIRTAVDPSTGEVPPGAGYDLILDGVFGYQFRPPIENRAASAFRWANRTPARLRAAVDLPSGLGEPDAFRADFTYATGIVKSPILSCDNAGRLRYLDLGFFRPEAGGCENAGGARVLCPRVFLPLARLRPPQTDKRDYGHLFVVGGSRSYPGAVLMTVMAALRSGVGLVTAFAPESLVPAFAARAPEAMWVGWPEAPAGGLALEGRNLLMARLARASAIVVGPGMGREAETLALVAEIAKASKVPLLIDADALQPDIVWDIRGPHVLTPHIGEFARIARGADLRTLCAKTGATVVLKGPVTCIAAATPPVYYSFFGGPVLARGGSGDILAGLAGGLLAQTPSEPVAAACRGVAWHGRAADLLARARGQTAVSVTQLLEFLPGALRDG